MTTPRERSQRYRRREERKRGKPKLGRPRGSKNKGPQISTMMKWYNALLAQGHSHLIALAVIRSQVDVTEIMFQNWKDKMQRNQQLTTA